jgi:hypothetical protein
VEQVLIKWSGMPVTLATWENLIAVKQRFPLAPAWGHARSQQEGDVSTVTQEAGPEDTVTRPEARPKSKRASRPNTNVFGPEWM